MKSRTWFLGFWARPRHTWLREVAFQFHLWTGLSIGLYALVIGLSGSALVFQEEIHCAVEPDVYTVQLEDHRASLESVITASRERFRDYKAGGIAGFDTPGKSLLLWMDPATRGVPAGHGINVYFNPHNGRILGERDPYQGVLGWFANLHYFLLMGETGAKANGILATVLLVLCLSGLVIWWPGRFNWRRGFRFNFRSNWKCINWDVHSNGGFWLTAVLVAFCMTAIYFEFPAPVSTALARLSGMKAGEISSMLTPPKSSASSAARISFDTALEVGKRNLPREAVATYLIAPSDPDGVFTLIAKHPGNSLFEGRVTVYIDQYNGLLLGKMDSREQTWGVKLILMTYPIHFGTWGGMFSRCLWVLVGLTPGLLFISGFLMWWNRVVRKQLTSRRRAGHAATKESPLNSPGAISST